MSLKLTFQIELQSDYHISAGHGTGAGVDSALQRDADGAPVIRGTTLTGLLRDGLWQLLKSDALKDHRGCQASGLPKNGVGEYCGQFKNGNQEPCPLCRIFGAPNLPKRWRIASARPASQKDKTFFADSHIEQHVRINPRMRRAEPRKLFAQEVGAASQVFTFTVISPVTNAGTLDEAAMLTAAARNVRLLGRSRRRGQGECRFKLVNVAGAENIKPDPDWQTAFLQRFDAQWLQSKPEPVSASVTASTLSHTPVENPQTYRVRLIVHADEPLLIAHRAEAGNQFASLPYVNGQTLLGAFAWRAARRYNLKDDPTYQAFMRLFRRGGIQFPNLYPAEMKTDLNPTIPAPRDLYTCKLAPGKPKHGHGLWFTTQTPQTKCQHPECGSPLQAVKGFVHLRAWKGDQDYEHKIGQTTEMHIRMEPESGRVTGGDLFGYVALDAGQYFVGDLLCQDKTDWDAFNKMTGLSLKKGEPLRIGKASSRGYGQVTAWFEEAHLDNDVWARQPLSGTVQELQLTLLTDTIIQDTWGRCATGFDHSWLKNVLDLDVAEKGIQAAAATRLVDGFNALLQLPRWRDVALAAGSTAHLTLATPVDLKTLNQFVLDGIGLRREEGFGQIAINHPIYPAYQPDQAVPVSIKMSNKTGMHLKRHRLPSWKQNWHNILDKADWQTCRNPRFTAIARWLHTNQGRPPEALAAEIETLGAPTEKFIKWFGRQEYGARAKENKLKKGNQEPIEGIDLIKKMLIKLNRYNQPFHPAGLEMLADRVAGAVDRDEN